MREFRKPANTWEWHAINKIDDLPPMALRCQFELRTGFRFYGRRIGDKEVQSYAFTVTNGIRTDNPVYRWEFLQAWRYPAL
nr:MAG TPA: Nepovirus coat protein, C-terminal domain [Caudoviricetes sp.]